jgi:hypothetical protein
MSVINFETHKGEIQAAIQSKIEAGVITDPSGFILIDGFINTPIQKDVGNTYLLGGPAIPAVAVVGKSTGLIYTFALKVLLPQIPF